MTLRLLSLTVLGLAIGACSRNLAKPFDPPALPADPRPALTTTLAQVGLDASALDRSVSPCDDFYKFACGGWLEKTPIPGDKSRWSRSFSEIDERNENTLREILESARSEPGSDPVLQKIGAFYGACMDAEGIEKAGLAPLSPLLTAASSVTDRPSLVQALATLHAHRVWALFDLSAEQDFKNATQMIGFLDQNGLGLPDRDYYLKDDEKSVKLRESYLAHIEKMLVLAGAFPADARTQAAAIMALETELAKASKTRVERRNPEALYNKIDRAGVEKTVPSLDWNAYFTSLGQPGLESLVVSSIPFFERVESLIQETPASTWQPYLRWHVLRTFASTLPKAFVEESFAFSQAITGQQQLEERWKRCIDATDAALGELLAQPFIERRFAGASKPATEEMIREVRAAFAQKLEGYDWMDEATRTRAKEKLDRMVFHIGYPSRWREYEFSITDSHAANAVASRAFETRRDLAKIGKPVDRQEWAMSPPTVNAYYSPLKNEMVFPAGILQPPFFDVNASVAVNLGAMGMVVGHELTHGFDDQGSQFAADGNLHQWWTAESRARFDERTQCIADQYSQYEALPGLKLDGRLKLGENIADQGGVKLAFAAYRSLRKNAEERLVAEGFSEDQQFFLAMGQAWCTNSREEVTRMLAQVAPHSPPEWRVNGTLSNVPEFAEAFACTAGQPMRPQKVCSVW